MKKKKENGDPKVLSRDYEGKEKKKEKTR